jgi:hypothetical protein
LVITGDSCSTWNAIGGFSNAKELLLDFNDGPIWQHRGRVSTAVWWRWQKSGSMVMAAVAVMITMKTKVTAAEVAALGQLGGSGGGSVATAAVLVRRQWQQWLDCLPHDRTPLPVQAGEDAAGVHPIPAATTALFGPNFLANLVRKSLAVYLLVAINYVPQPRQGRPPLEQCHPQQTALVTMLSLQDKAVTAPAVVVVEQQSCKGW